jgi:hypothetical protein
MYARLWHGYTTPENAAVFESIVHKEIFPELQHVRGFIEGKLLRRDLPGEVEFVGLTYFDSIESMREAVGAVVGNSLVPPSAKAILNRYDQRTALYEVAFDSNEYGPLKS